MRPLLPSFPKMNLSNGAYEVPLGHLSIIGFGSCGSDIGETEILEN
jgi:hypothetical protein